jgi:choline dehydrogenase-like flavoprotein
VRATGVEYATGSVAARYNVVAAKEVIVAAGAVQSPALLQLSGIGDSAKLTALGITPVINLPGVGKNLQDQTMSNIGWPKTQSDGVSALSGTIAYPNIDALFSTSSRVAEIKQMIQSSVDQYATDAAAAGALVSKCAGQVLFGAQADMMVNKGVGLVELFFDNGDPNGGYGIKAWNLLPFARGSVDITSADPFAALRIQTRYFSAEVDKTIQIQGARMARQAFKSAPLRNVVTEETMPGFSAVPDNAQGGTDADWWSNIESNFLAVNHQIATCSMMDETFGGVVDANLRVYHTTNIRVVDASVLPHQISAHLSATLYGIAENAADIIKAANQ